MSREVAIGCLALVGGCAGSALKLPEDPLRLTVIQRRAEEIPGSDRRMLLCLGDITGGQVLVSIADRGGKPYLRTCSVADGDTVPFQVDDRRYYLSVIELRNFLTGDDFGVFEISSRPPRGAPVP